MPLARNVWMRGAIREYRMGGKPVGAECLMITPRMAAVSIVSIAVYLGLAICGGGGFTAFFAEPARTAIAVITVMLVVASLFTSVNLSSGEREDRGNRWVFTMIGVLGITAAFVPAYTDRIEFWTIDGEFTRWTGVTLYTIGGILRLWPVFVLGRRFSGLVAIQPEHTLVTTGVYRFIRHPSYLGLLINALGWALTFRSGIGVLLAALLVVPIVGRIHAEEALLRSQFGAEYEAFRSRTSRLIPGVY